MFIADVFSVQDILKVWGIGGNVALIIRIGFFGGHIILMIV